MSNKQLKKGVLITYYDSLGKSKKADVSGFENALIKEALRRNKGNIDGYDARMKDPYFFNAFKGAVAREEQFKDLFVFYSGYSSKFDFQYDFVTILENLLFVEIKQKQRSFFEKDFKIFKSMQDFWASDTGTNLLTGKTEYLDYGEAGKYLCSTNIALFGNLLLTAANTCSFFCKDPSRSKVDVLATIVGGLCEVAGLNFEAFKSDLQQIYERYENLDNKLMQFFIRPEDVENVAYMAVLGGFPFFKKGHTTFKEWKTTNRRGLETVADALEDAGCDSLKKIIGLLRNEPNNKNLVQDAWTGGIKGLVIDFLQARLVTSPVIFDKTKVKIFYYFTTAEKEREHKLLQQELRDLVVKMIIDGLEKGTIQKNKVKVEALGKTVKLPSLFQKVMRPVIKDPLVTALTLLKAKLLSLAQSLSGGVTSKGMGKKDEGKLKVLQAHPYSSVWPAVAKIVNGEKFPIENEKILKEISELDLGEFFVSDCEKYKDLNNKIPKHIDNDGLFRIATYNVHSFWAPLVSSTVTINFDNILNVVRNVNADVIVLQEVAWNNKSKNKNDVFFIDNINNEFKKLGYVDSVYSDIGKGSMGGDNYGNVIFSKKDFLDKKATIGKYDKEGKQQRSYAGVQIKLPNNKIVSLWGTHLDVYDETEKLREEQIIYLTKLTQKQENIIIAADFNADRMQDYQYMVDGKLAWNLVQTGYRAYLKFNQKIDPFDIPQRVHNYLADQRFVDCFTKANILGPKFTVWTGKVVDFLYIKEKTWDKDLEIAGCYVYYNAASDHLPVIMDIKMK